MMRPEQIPPKECGNFLADLPKYMGLDEPALERENIYPHYSVCPRCRQNLGTAREMAGAFTGMKARITAPAAAKVAVGSRLETIENAVRMALRSNRAELSQVFTDLGKSLYIEALRLNEVWDTRWVATGPLRDVPSYRKVGMDLANDSVLFCKATKEKDIWNETQEELVRNPAQNTWQNCLNESLRYLVVARRLDSQNEAATIDLAQNYFLRKEVKQAMEAANQILKESSAVLRLTQAHNNLGSYLYSEGRIKEALEHCMAARRLSPLEPTVTSNIAAYALQLGDRELAFATYEAIDADANAASRARGLIECVHRKALALYCRNFPKDLHRLETEFPHIFAPDVSKMLRSEVSS